MNEVGSKTRRYCARSKNHYECCKHNEHNTIKEAFDCLVSKGVDPCDVAVNAIDCVFGMRAIVPTFGKEWKEVADIRAALRGEGGK